MESDQQPIEQTGRTIIKGIENGILLDAPKPVLFNYLGHRLQLLRAIIAGMVRIANFSGGQHVAPLAGWYLPNIEPATGQVHAELPDSDGRDVEAAVQAALAAFPPWSRTPAAERSRLLLDIAARIEANLDRLAHAEAVDAGKPLRLARTVDIPRAASNFRFFATAIVHCHSEAYRTDQLALNYTLRQPRGV
ncbi:MAG: aldehyde dehydrogenase family protein, partial [Planctomycetia bacterium]|nr:aldehyde dehydrogenase family protein [Planctomycetia bacterium]